LRCYSNLPSRLLLSCIILRKRLMSDIRTQSTRNFWAFWISLLMVLSPQMVASQSSIDVRVDRWLSVESLTGQVEYLSAQSQRSAQVGDYLINVDDGIKTGEDSSSTLRVDTGIGTITLLDNTELRIQRLDFAPDNGRITHLYVSQGNVRVNLRRFSHPGSEFDIETPSGVSGVRGTEFGVIVHPEDSRTGIATQSGAVYAAAQAVTVTVPDGFQTLIRPGEPPLDPTPIPAEPTFTYRIDYLVEGDQRRIELIGKIDPINQVYVDEILQSLNEVGEFRYAVLPYRGATVRVRVVTPLGDELERTIIPLGRAPSPPQSAAVNDRLPEILHLDYRVEYTLQSGQRQLQFIGKADPNTTVYIDGIQQSLDESGEFRYETPAYRGLTLQIRVVNPEGETAEYDIPLL